jgi:predicted O-methyltransferase YrrM
VQHEVIWKYTEDFPSMSPAVELARRHSLELGVTAVSPAVGAQLRFLAAATGATAMLEVGTGAGVSGLYLFEGSPDGVLTTIDVEPDYQASARSSYLQAGIAANRQRFIAGRAQNVLPRMSDEAYDLVLVDADAGGVLGYVEHALRTVRDGGMVLVARALQQGRVADPARRESELADYRALLETVRDSAAVQVSLSAAGDGLLQLVKLGG